MKAGSRILKPGAWITGVSMLILICSVAVTQNKAKNGLQKKIPPIGINSALEDKDSVEIMGTPTGDDPWNEVSKLVNAYYPSGGIEYKGVIKVIDDNGDTEKVIEEQPFEYTILNTDYYYRLADMEIVNKKNLLIAIDNTNKTISLAKNVVLQKNKKVFDIRAFKKVMQKGKVHAMVTRMGNEKVITIDSINDPDIQGYRIYYSPETYQVHKMLIGMARLSPLEDENDSQEEINEPINNTEKEPGITTYYYYLELLFTQIKPLALQIKDFNPEHKFMQITKDSITLTPAYKDYQLLNSIEP